VGVEGAAPPRLLRFLGSRGLVLMGLVLLCAHALAETPADEQARRLLEDGRTYWSQGKFKQALDNFNTIVTGFSTTPSAPAALLEIGRYRLEVEGNVEKGRAALEDVAQRFPQSEGAPGAYFYLGLLALNKASTPAELEDALAQFNRVQRLYPRSEWVPKSLYAAGLVHRKAGRLPDAIDAERRVALEYPSSEPAAAAQFQIGHCFGLLGEARLAMEEFQRVRNRYPDSEWAASALDRITALYRLFGGGKPVFSLDPGYSVGAGDVLKDVRALAMGPESTLWIASEKAHSAVSFDRTGKMGPSLQAEDIKTLSLSPKGDIVVAARLAVRIGKDLKGLTIPSDKPGVGEPLEHIQAAVVTPGGSLLVSDEKKKRVFRFDTQFQFQGSFPDAKERQVSRMSVDGEGGIIFLDRDDKSVQVFDEAGHSLRSLRLKGAGFEVRKPADVASDPLRDLYVADEDGGVFVFSPQGQLLTTLSAEELKHPRALTLDVSGSVLVYEDHAQKVLRFR
jgi:TolA-binding protein